ncbi:MotA/TolQ/ExbB proton channel family protein [Halomonas sp. MCCC 1A17488]|uniref:MotA/TolQ/ExbB proton channel family protein n=1 Tax=unclassified Halomonas TaxID=2609666 RepID=UPI0018D20E24|nr:MULTISPECIES: MotA/TolQ/ExbB proton channel family protein [unclassified Halomonas]MCE8015638.1 MotA/TolQ/ExbB proton channel family protein [Halomonas sp. MCCC 1A17488]MCG3238971.1 MotA/TolQ/ExbB proton channel family protein [Halomonas sp. MCCC 1A17488]QPP51077.1 MotA/TolQ/ExbB proton channel family protein [Halomonas sp. SS10-MC5]
MTVTRVAAGLLAALWLSTGLTQVQAQTEPLESLRAEREAAEGRDRARLAELVEDREALEAALEEARASHAEAEARHAKLQQRARELDERAEAIEARQNEQGDELEAILASLKRHSGELRDGLADSWLLVGGAELPPRLDDAEVLELEHLEAFADSLIGLTVDTGRVIRFEAPVADAGGEVAPREVVRLGDFAAFTDSHLLRRGADGEGLSVVERTPPEVVDSLAAFHAGESRELTLDPTRGEVMAALAQRPSLPERFHHGGAVGYVVVGLGAIGLLVALLQYAYLLKVTLAMRRQLRDLDALREDNPLGRVLLRFGALRDDPVPEALEARLDEAVLAELPRLERGQPIVKLLAAVAPLLGLLGTVTGMIVTFQAITVFGTGDPQLMAGGISQALVTTVLGLITAVPLLFAHTALAGRSRRLAGLVEGQASAALAEQLEQRPHGPDSITGSARRDPALA